nr:PREDICTED: E3 ubiquitin-protein ligase TRIM69-like [Latimeria chalumnae]|eukprot:XP_006014505.2 PREDICTED: E3 ubiquitin-protein ligase TRIM69-like [Latimeria chalumnae]
MRDFIDHLVPDSITIDPRTANPFLIVSEDRTSLQFSSPPQKVSDNLERFAINSYCAALGSEGFISGRHYWEVEVGNKKEWMLGVVRESVDRKSMPRVTNENGFYVIRREKERICIPFITNLPFPVNLHKIKVFLDYEGGQVAFYNADDMSHIHTYTYTFTEKMYPYFDVWWNSNGNTPEPLKLITPNN